MEESIFFILFVGLLGYEIWKFVELTRVKEGHHETDNFAPRVPYADFDYTNEMDLEQGNFLSVQRDGAGYIYKLPSGVLYKSYYPYGSAAEENYKLPDTNVSFA